MTVTPEDIRRLLSSYLDDIRQHAASFDAVRRAFGADHESIGLVCIAERKLVGDLEQQCVRIVAAVGIDLAAPAMRDRQDELRRVVRQPRETITARGKP